MKLKKWLDHWLDKPATADQVIGVLAVAIILAIILLAATGELK